MLGTLNILLAGRDAGVERVVQTSSSEVYGTAQTVPMEETHPLHGQSPYAASKIAADQFAESFHLSYDLAVTTPPPVQYVWATSISASGRFRRLFVQGLRGNAVELGNLAPIRDFTYVSDTVAASPERASRGGDRPDHRPWNLERRRSATSSGSSARSWVSLSSTHESMRLGSVAPGARWSGLCRIIACAQAAVVEPDR